MNKTNQMNQINPLVSLVAPVPSERETHRGTLQAELKWVKHWRGTHKISQPGTSYTLV